MDEILEYNYELYRISDSFLIYANNKDIDMDQQGPPYERNEKDNNRDLSNPEFSFKYTESGGITNRYLLISYNSKTNIITSSTDVRCVAHVRE